MGKRRKRPDGTMVSLDHVKHERARGMTISAVHGCLCDDRGAFLLMNEAYERFDLEGTKNYRYKL